METVNDALLVSLLLTLKIIENCSGVSNIDFEHAHATLNSISSNKLLITINKSSQLFSKTVVRGCCVKKCSEKFRKTHWKILVLESIKVFT